MFWKGHSYYAVWYASNTPRKKIFSEQAKMYCINKYSQVRKKKTFNHERSLKCKMWGKVKVTNLKITVRLREHIGGRWKKTVLVLMHYISTSLSSLEGERIRQKITTVSVPLSQRSHWYRVTLTRTRCSLTVQHNEMRHGRDCHFYLFSSHHKKVSLDR